MGRIIFLIFIVVPLIEIGLFVVVGQAIGLPLTLVGVLVTAVIGSVIVRRQGLALLFESQKLMNSGQLPARQLAEGVMVAVAGALLLTPGYFTDLCGFMLLVSPVRAGLYAILKSRVSISGVADSDISRRSTDDDIIDLDAEDWRGR